MNLQVKRKKGWKTIAKVEAGHECLAVKQIRGKRTTAFRAVSPTDVDRLGGRSKPVKVRARGGRWPAHSPSDMLRGARISAAAVLVLGLFASETIAPAGAAAQTILDVSVSVKPTPFSPNEDGRRDETIIGVEVSAAADVTITIQTLDGVVLREWRRTATVMERVEIEWSGEVDGATLPDGRYRIHARGQAVPEEPADADVAEAQDAAIVTIDTRPPRVRRVSIRPDPVLDQRRIRLRFIARDRAPRLQALVIVRSAADRIMDENRRVRPGTARIRWSARYPAGGRLFPGNYTATLRLTDEAGNVSRAATVPWRVHRPTPGRVFTRLEAGRRVALTFDDCHNNNAWPRILRILRRNQVHATFFCPGETVLARPDLARRTIREGHAAGAHGFDHASLPGHGAWFTESRLRGDADAWWSAARTSSAPFMRPPYGAYDGTVVRAAGATGHPRVIMWDVDPLDWTLPGAGTISSRVLSQARPGSIILLHTLHMTADALPSIISGLRHRRLEPVTLPELFAAARMR